MNKAFYVFGVSAVASAVLAYPLTSHAGWIGHGFADCMPNMDNQNGTTYGYFYQNGGNQSPHEMVLSCVVTETSDRPKTTYQYAYIKARDYSSSGSVKVMACLNSESGSGGGCSNLHATTGSTGAIESISIPQTELASIWPSSSGYAYIAVYLPNPENGNKSSVVGYYYGSFG